MNSRKKAFIGWMAGSVPFWVVSLDDQYYLFFGGSRMGLLMYSLVKWQSVAPIEREREKFMVYEHI